jgi:hypothetical protein
MVKRLPTNPKLFREKDFSKVYGALVKKEKFSKNT